MTALAGVLSGLILAILVGRAAFVLRAERGAGATRGVAPGPGHTEILSEYASGLGGERMTTRVPRDPQSYARAFVPRRNGKHRS